MSRRDEENNPYAPPGPVFEARGRSGRGRPSTDSTNAWCENELVVVPRFGGDLPERCVVCNQRTSYKLRRTFQWHNPGYYFLICVGWVVYLIVFFIVRKTAIVHLGLCQTHEARRKNGLYILWGGVLAGVFFVILGATTKTPVITLVAFLGVLLAALVGGFQARVVTVKKMDENYVYLVTGGEFMRSLPTSPDEEPPPPPRKKKKRRAAPTVESHSAPIPPPWAHSAEEDKAAAESASEAAEDDPSKEPVEDSASKEPAEGGASKEPAEEGESKEPVNTDESKGAAGEDASKKREDDDDAAS